MTAVSFVDELVREYLLFRGFVATLKAFDNDLKNDKDKGFRADKIVDQLCSYVTNYDLTTLRETWNHMEQRIFCHLEQQFSGAVRKLENSLLKMYIVNTIQTSRHDKLIEFFDKMGQELQNQPEWKDWFVLPFLKNPEENPSYAGYFTRQWQDTMLVSLHNFLSSPLPVLLNYEEERTKINQLQDENEMLRQQVAALQAREIALDKQTPNKLLDSSDISLTGDIMDDFYVLAQEPSNIDTQSKSLRSIIKNISSGLPTSPILGRRPSAPQISRKMLDSDLSGSSKQSTKTKTRGNTQLSSSMKNRPVSEYESSKRSPTIVVQINKSEESFSKFKETSYSKKDTSPNMDNVRIIPKDVEKSTANVICGGDLEDSKKSPLLLLSQEDYTEHQSAITHCKFNESGSLIASSDIDGVIKIWKPSPSPLTLATVISKSSVLSLEWTPKHERFLLFGNRTGIIRLYDTQEKKTMWEIGMDGNSPLKDQKIVNLACSPLESYFVSSTAVKFNTVGFDETMLLPLSGNLILWDMKKTKLLKQLNLKDDSSVVNCSLFNHNGQLLIVGDTRGNISIFDMRNYECIAQWKAHSGETHTIELSSSETTCYSMGSEGKFCQWNINNTGQKVSEHNLMENCAGPFMNPIGSTSQKNQYHRPVGKLFCVDSEGKHVLTCGNTSAIISMIPDGKTPPTAVMRLEGHKVPVITMDWATTMDCGTCISASLDGQIRVSTLLAK
uniref:WD repeat-containing protein 91 n=1 Tax=Strigamia maritima TaxID=126957 RepID=T1IIU8_STRMM